MKIIVKILMLKIAIMSVDKKSFLFGSEPHRVQN